MFEYANWSNGDDDDDDDNTWGDESEWDEDE